MSEEVLTVAVIGARYWGKNLVRSFATAQRCALKYVCDIDAKVLAMHRRSFPFVETISSSRRSPAASPCRWSACSKIGRSAAAGPRGCGSCRCSKPDRSLSRITAYRPIRRNSDA